MNAPVRCSQPTRLTPHRPQGAHGHSAGRRLAFLHIPKTAGTAFGAALAQYFPLGQSLETMHLAGMAGGTNPLLAEIASRFQLIGVGNHLDRDKLDAIEAALPSGERLFTVTLLRDPRARLISQYRHWRRAFSNDGPHNTPEYREVLRAAHGMPLGPFLAERLEFVDRHLRDMQVRMLAGIATSEFLDDTALLTEARASLAEIEVVGTTDTVDEALARIAKAYGWPAPDSVRPLNVAPGAPPPMDDATEVLIEEYTRLDRILWQEIVAGAIDPAPPRPRYGFFRQAPALLGSLVEGGLTRFTMDMPLHGQGWHRREGIAPLARWTGPGLRSTIRLAAPPARVLRISLQLVSVLNWDVVRGCALTLDDRAPVAAPEVVTHGEHPWLEAVFHLPDAGNGQRDLELQVPFTLSHEQVDPSLADKRQKGLAIGEIRLTAVLPDAPVTLGSLFWPGRAWSDEPRENLVDLLNLARGEGPVLADYRHIGLDRQLLSAILDLVAPDHVWPSIREASWLATFARGTPEAVPSPGATLAILATLFEMPGRGRAIATLAARFRHATLLLPCAEDHRLRALVTNPSLAPHLHIVGCTNAILLASLGGLRESGGDQLVEGFLLMLERIASTTPELIGKLSPQVAEGHVRRQIVHALEEIAAAEGATSPMLIALVPERAAATSPASAPAMLQARLEALRTAPGAILRFADPALVDDLTAHLGALSAAEAGSPDAWHAVISAHDRAFRLAGMAAGWRAFDIAANETAKLAARLPGQASILPKPLKPFGEYIDFYKGEARIMARGGLDPALRLALETLGGGLDHVVRLNQAAREVEIALRLLGRCFPGEEILWVDAGCSYGVLLNNVEPPSALGGRYRFLGFDFNAPVVEAARIAAANAGNAHCRFEVGDVAEAVALAAGRRIHLLTAFEVLEHCPDPFRVLRDYRAMDPGMLIVGSPMAETQGILPAEQHLWSFTAEGYMAMVQEAGFAPVGLTKRDVGRFVGGHDWVTVTATTASPATLAQL